MEGRVGAANQVLSIIPLSVLSSLVGRTKVEVLTVVVMNCLRGLTMMIDGLQKSEWTNGLRILKSAACQMPHWRWR